MLLFVYRHEFECSKSLSTIWKYKAYDNSFNILCRWMCCFWVVVVRRLHLIADYLTFWTVETWLLSYRCMYLFLAIWFVYIMYSETFNMYESGIISLWYEYLPNFHCFCIPQTPFTCKPLGGVVVWGLTVHLFFDVLVDFCKGGGLGSILFFFK